RRPGPLGDRNRFQVVVAETAGADVGDRDVGQVDPAVGVGDLSCRAGYAFGRVGIPSPSGRQRHWGIVLPVTLDRQWQTVHSWSAARTVCPLTAPVIWVTYHLMSRSMHA